MTHDAEQPPPRSTQNMVSKRRESMSSESKETSSLEDQSSLSEAFHFPDVCLIITGLPLFGDKLGRFTAGCLEPDDPVVLTLCRGMLSDASVVPAEAL